MYILCIDTLWLLNVYIMYWHPVTVFNVLCIDTLWLFKRLYLFLISYEYIYYVLTPCDFFLLCIYTLLMFQTSVLCIDTLWLFKLLYLILTPCVYIMYWHPVTFKCIYYVFTPCDCFKRQFMYWHPVPVSGQLTCVSPLAYIRPLLLIPSIPLIPASSRRTVAVHTY